MVDDLDAAAALFPERVGDRLRAARLAAGMDLSDIAGKTRVPLRHLQAIESGDYASLPGTTYCIGFVKSFARIVGIDENAAADDVRGELRELNLDQRAERTEYQIADATRLPSKTLAWIGVAVALLIAVGYAVIRNNQLYPAATGEVVQAAEEAQVVEAAESGDTAAALPANGAPALNPVPVGSGEVVLTASNNVWLRIYDASDKVLFEKEMAAGERYVVPADANDPKIRTGRADLIAVTVNGKAVPTLGPAERTVKDVGISASALLARPAAVTPEANAGVTSAVPSIPRAIPPARP